MLDRPTAAALNQIADTLPDTEDQLLRAGKEAIFAYDAAIMGEAETAAEAARARYEAAIWKLNNRDHFASYGSDDAPGPRMAKYCAAAPGTPGLWGQACEFIVEARGVVAILQAKGGFSLGGGFGWYVHPDRHDSPFISPTGFQSYMSPSIILGATLKQAAEIWLAAIVAAKPPAVMPADSFARTRHYKWPWIGAEQPTASPAGSLMAFPF